jgi:hypothetical protein|tara:strand:+ start:861 stop:1082 length:222 start_codon:yes stop_codon:yes gene_type:complete
MDKRKNPRPRRTPKQIEVLTKNIIEYFFNNPHANSNKEIQEKFDVDEIRVRKILNKELERRYKNSIARKYSKL